MVNHFSKLNSFRDMNFQKWSVSDESFINVYKTDNLHDSSVIDHFWKFITLKILGFEKWFTTNFLPHGHRKKMYAFLFPFSIVLYCGHLGLISPINIYQWGNLYNNHSANNQLSCLGSGQLITRRIMSVKQQTWRILDLHVFSSK